MIKILLTLLLANAAAEPAPVKAVWKSYQYAGPDYRRYDCGPALSALDALLTAMDAREVRKGCSWNYGISASWEALAPLKQDAPESRVASLMKTLSKSAEGWLGGKARDWKDDSVDAQWGQAQLQVNPGPGRACQVYAEVLDYLLETLPVRKVSSQVFCDGGSGMISVSLEYLAPAEAGRTGRRPAPSPARPATSYRIAPNPLSR